MSIAKSDIITNDDKTPPDLNPVGLLSGRVREAKGEVTLAAADLATSDIILLASLPTTARVNGIWIMNEDLDTNATETIEFDVGVFTTAGVAKSSAVYFDGSVDGAALFEDVNKDFINVYFKGAAAVKDQLWEDAGDSTDPGGRYTVGILVKIGAATAVAAPTIAFKIQYTVD